MSSFKRLAQTVFDLELSKRVIVAELNSGMFADYLQAKFPDVKISRINKIQGQPFLVSEVVEGVNKIMEDK